MINPELETGWTSADWDKWRMEYGPNPPPIWLAIDELIADLAALEKKYEELVRRL